VGCIRIRNAYGIYGASPSKCRCPSDFMVEFFNGVRTFTASLITSGPIPSPAKVIYFILYCFSSLQPLRRRRRLGVEGLGLSFVLYFFNFISNFQAQFRFGSLLSVSSKIRDWRLHSAFFVLQLLRLLFGQNLIAF
jgi:hypothetical protein